MLTLLGRYLFSDSSFPHGKYQWQRYQIYKTGKQDTKKIKIRYFDVAELVRRN